MVNHLNSKKVYLRRLPLSVQEANGEKNEEIKDYFDKGHREIGSYWPKDSVRPGTGLTIMEENSLMPRILNIENTDRDFRQRVTDYFHSITTRVDPTDKKGQGGTTLEIGLEKDNNLPMDMMTNPPLNVKDYIHYRHAISHPWVAMSEEEGKGNMLAKFFVYDPAKEIKNKTSRGDKQDEAMAAYLSIKDSPTKVLQYLTLMNENPKDHVGLEVGTLRGLASTKAKKFLEVHNDTDKDYKFLVHELVTAKILKMVGTRYLTVEGNNMFAGNMEEAIAELKDPKNSQQLLIFKSMIKDFKSKNKVSKITPIPEETVLAVKEVQNQLTEQEINNTEQVGGLADLD